MQETPKTSTLEHHHFVASCGGKAYRIPSIIATSPDLRIEEAGFLVGDRWQFCATVDDDRLLRSGVSANLVDINKLILLHSHHNLSMRV